VGKFIKKVGLSRNECGLYWETLLLDGFALFAAESVKGEAQVIELCDGKNIKFWQSQENKPLSEVSRIASCTRFMQLPMYTVYWYDKSRSFMCLKCHFGFNYKDWQPDN